MDEEQYKFYMRIQIFRKDRSFGPGVSELMLLIRETESLSAACRQMNMAYSKAWKIIKRAEEDLGFSLMEGTRGGGQGGRTVLTREGEELLERYLRFEAEARETVTDVFHKHFR